jgi:proteasome alpha subunit
MPFYMSPEQVMKDKSDYARKGIARGRSVLALTYADGILFIGENPSNALHKMSEIYDRIAFAAVGKYNEFENLRLAGVRYADLRGYQYDRSDVTSRGLANAYAQTLGAVFTEASKPYEVELVVAEVGATAAEDQMYRLTYDGSVADESGFVVMGGQSEPIAAVLRERHTGDEPLADALRLAVDALSQAGPDGEARTLVADSLEAAVLDRTRPRRAFKRLLTPQLERLLAPTSGDTGAADTTTDTTTDVTDAPGA